MTEQREFLLTRLGFRFGINGPHAARTMRLGDLPVLLSHTSPSATRADYIAAIVAENVLGNAQLQEIFNRFDEISALTKAWTKTAEDIAKRLPAWRKLNDLLRHARALGPYAQLKTEVDAIETQRSLLVEPHPARPLLDKVVDLLRNALNSKLMAFKHAFEQQQAQLNADADWRRLGTERRADLTVGHHFSLPAEVALATPEQLQDALDDCDVDHWASRRQALPSRFDAARHAAVHWLKPNVVQVAIPRRTINDEAELKAWLAEVESLVAAKLKSGLVAL